MAAGVRDQCSPVALAKIQRIDEQKLELGARLRGLAESVKGDWLCVALD
jgi:hypothetical protein